MQTRRRTSLQQYDGTLQQVTQRDCGVFRDIFQGLAGHLPV